MLIMKSQYADSQIFAYICDVVFNVFLEISFKLEFCDDNLIHIVSDGKEIRMAADLFDVVESEKHSNLSLKSVNWDSRSIGDIKLINPFLPVLFGKPEAQFSSNVISIGFDILGTIFFMLSRYEEKISSVRDIHNRFPGVESIAYKEGFLDRPIVNEYIEVLWFAMKSLWPRLERKLHNPSIRVTCDVDAPYEESIQSPVKLLRDISRDFIKKKQFKDIGRKTKNYYASRRNDYSLDICDNFNWYMDACEIKGRQASFYFIPAHSAGRVDGYYEILEPRILTLIKRISHRGHELGVHSSYNTYNDPDQLLHERNLLIEACRKVGVEANISGNRQHYLRWDSAQTPSHLNKAGYKYDTSGAYADVAGFRYGTSWSFPMWDWQSMSALSLQQIPLVLMECSVIADRYMGLGYSDEALDKMLDYKKNSMAYGGTFTLLWHNNHFGTDKDKAFFKELIQ